MIEQLCAAINLKPILFEPGVIPKFKSKVFSFTYNIPEIELKIQKHKNGLNEINGKLPELTDFLIKLKNQIWEDLASVSHKGCVYFSNYGCVESQVDKNLTIYIQGYEYCE